MNDINPKQRDSLKKLVAFLKDAGVDVTNQNTKVQLLPTEANLTVQNGNTAEHLDLVFDTGEVKYLDNMTNKSIGNINDKEGLINSLKSTFSGQQQQQQTEPTQQNNPPPPPKQQNQQPAPQTNQPVREDDGKMLILKEQIKIYIRKFLEEMSSTGGGASFSPGAGENYATPNAFVGGKAKNPKKKKYTISKKLTW